MHSKNFLWEISNSPYPSEFLTDTREFGKSSLLYLVDQYDGKRPALINDEFLSSRKMQFEMYPSALLDSNVVTAIDNRVSRNALNDGLEDFLRFVTEKKWDFNPLFYYMEHYAKSKPEDFLPNAIRRTEAILRLESMDEGYFLENGIITPNPEAVEHYTSDIGVKTLNEVAEHQVTSFIKDYDRSALNGMIEATQIALIKMVLIHKSEMPQASPAQKHASFISFLRDNLGIMLARETHLALHYFCDQAGKLLGIQSSTSSDRALSIIKSTAWDIFLLRFPEIPFSHSPTRLCISYVTTFETRLQELARLFTIERISSDGSSGFTPQVSYDLSRVPQRVIDAIPKDQGISASRTGGERSLNVPVGLLNALECELVRFCVK